MITKMAKVFDWGVTSWEIVDMISGRGPESEEVLLIKLGDGRRHILTKYDLSKIIWDLFEAGTLDGIHLNSGRVVTGAYKEDE